MLTVSPDQPIRVQAHAKLNLGLEVTGRRQGGYHDIVTILQTISLSDEITIFPANEFSYQPVPGIEQANDLVSRALDLLRSQEQVELKAAVIVEKHIPVAAGLGGGSADAAAILRTIGQLAGIRLNEIASTGSALGSDIPFLIQGGTALGTGTGTTLELIPTPEECWFAVLIPEIEIPEKTATLYRSLSADRFSDGHRTLEQAERLRRGDPVDSQLIANSFEDVLVRYPAFVKARDLLEQVAGEATHVSGAGPAVFTICGSRAEAETLVAELADRGLRAVSCRAIAAN